MTTNIIPMRTGIPQWTFADRVRKVRRDLKWTQGKMAAALGVQEAAYSAWETGRNTPDLAKVAPKLEEITGVDRAWFLGWADNNAPDPEGAEGGQSGRRDSNSQHSAWNDDTVIELFPTRQAIAA
jgi:transcriptional regulator with XRE-family HTH domain